MTEQMPCLPKFLTPHGAECWFAGKGKTENSNQATEVRSVTINAMDRDYCIDESHRQEIAE